MIASSLHLGLILLLALPAGRCLSTRTPQLRRYPSCPRQTRPSRSAPAG
jgi:hypothetical protein